MRDALFGPYVSFFKIFVYFLYPKRYLQVLYRLQWWYLAQTMRYTSFGPLVSVFFKLFTVFLKLTTIIQRFSNLPKRRDPNNGVTVVWAPVLFYYTQPPKRPPQHGHLTTPSHQQQAAGDDEGLRHTSSSISSLWKKAQTTRDASFGPLVSFF